MNRPIAPNPAARTHALIRIAHVVGVLLFGGVIWYLHSQPGWTPTDPGFPIRTVASVIWAVAVAALLVLRVRWGAASDAVSKGRLSIFAMSIAEVPALFGGVIYFNTDDPRLYLTGIFLMLTTLLLFPIVRNR